MTMRSTRAFSESSLPSFGRRSSNLHHLFNIEQRDMLLNAWNISWKMVCTDSCLELSGSLENTSTFKSAPVVCIQFNFVFSREKIETYFPQICLYPHEETTQVIWIYSKVCGECLQWMQKMFAQNMFRHPQTLHCDTPRHCHETFIITLSNTVPQSLFVYFTK